VSGILEADTTPYDVLVYVDLDGSGGYSPGDPSWSTTVTSSATGFRGTLDLATLPNAPIDIGAPP